MTPRDAMRCRTVSRRQPAGPYLRLALAVFIGSCSEEPDVVASRALVPDLSATGEVPDASTEQANPCDLSDVVHETFLPFEFLFAAAQCSFPRAWLNRFDRSAQETMDNVNAAALFYEIYSSDPVQVAPDEWEIACDGSVLLVYFDRDYTNILLCPEICRALRSTVLWVSRDLECDPLDLNYDQ